MSMPMFAVSRILKVWKHVIKILISLSFVNIPKANTPLLSINQSLVLLKLWKSSPEKSLNVLQRYFIKLTRHLYYKIFSLLSTLPFVKAERRSHVSTKLTSWRRVMVCSWDHFMKLPRTIQWSKLTILSLTIPACNLSLILTNSMLWWVITQIIYAVNQYNLGYAKSLW